MCRPRYASKARPRRRSSTSSAPTGSELAYLDASALVKLVRDEPQSDALRQAVRAWPRRASSRIVVVEVIRAVRRADARLEPSAARALSGVSLLLLSDHVLRVAALLDPAGVRTLDSIHLASALRVRAVLSAFVSYDRRQLEAAEAVGLPVASPS
ncbi:MAG TPA: type II toxin-antitoxin system VapC family toxin [Gaiellaceae bacterium]|nr:type II toxin-antitoxin system VapC family toxin [Gaiellaceae bacterium]